MLIAEGMKAAVLHPLGGPEALKIEDRLVPVPQAGEVLIRVEAFASTARSYSPDKQIERCEQLHASTGNYEMLWGPRPT